MSMAHPGLRFVCPATMEPSQPNRITKGTKTNTAHLVCEKERAQFQNTSLTGDPVGEQEAHFILAWQRIDENRPQKCRNKHQSSGISTSKNLQRGECDSKPDAEN